ncbi:MAG: GNAT family N-acetyltransferase [Planctomycetota bacterium]
MDFSIRDYEPDLDYDACRALWVHLTKHHRKIYENDTIGGDDPGGDFDVFLADPKRCGAWVAVDGDAVVGFTGLLLHGEDEGELEPMIVAPAMRGRGLGQALAERVIDAARGLGVKSLSVRPVGRNQDAIGFFARVGFDIVGHVELFQKLTAAGDQEWRAGVVLMHDQALRC